MVLDEFPSALSAAPLNISDDRIDILAMINALLLLLGMFVDDISRSILVAVTIAPIAAIAGVHPIHFAAIVGTNIALDNLTPPCAPPLFLAGAVGKVSGPELMRPTMKF